MISIVLPIQSKIPINSQTGYHSYSQRTSPLNRITIMKDALLSYGMPHSPCCFFTANPSNKWPKRRGSLTITTTLFNTSLHIYNFPINMNWQSAAAKKKSSLEATIPLEWRIKSFPPSDSAMSFPRQSGILTEEELNITESSATQLVRDIAAGKLTSVAVTTAFCKRAALAHQLVR